MNLTYETTLKDDRLRALPGQVRQRGQRLVQRTITQIEAEAKALIQAPGHGVVYGGHQASAPGEPPATDLGNLVNSAGSEMTGPLTGVYYETLYGLMLEVGTVTIAKRPHVAPAVETVRKDVWQPGLKELFPSV